MGLFSRLSKKTDGRSSPDFPYKMQAPCPKCEFPHVVHDMRESPCYIAVLEANREVRWGKERLMKGMERFSKFFKKRPAALAELDADFELVTAELRRAEMDPVSRKRVTKALHRISKWIKQEKLDVADHLTVIEISMGLREEPPTPKRPTPERARTMPAQPAQPARPARPVRPVRPTHRTRRTQDPRNTPLEDLFVTNPE